MRSLRILLAVILVLVLVAVVPGRTSPVHIPERVPPVAVLRVRAWRNLGPPLRRDTPLFVGVDVVAAAGWVPTKARATRQTTGQSWSGRLAHAVALPAGDPAHGRRYTTNGGPPWPLGERVRIDVGAQDPQGRWHWFVGGHATLRDER